MRKAVIRFKPQLQPRGPAAAVVLDAAQVAVVGEGAKRFPAAATVNGYKWRTILAAIGEASSSTHGTLNSQRRRWRERRHRCRRCGSDKEQQDPFHVPGDHVGAERRRHYRSGS
jgi:hypothetical protein